MMFIMPMPEITERDRRYQHQHQAQNQRDAVERVQNGRQVVPRGEDRPAPVLRFENLAHRQRLPRPPPAETALDARRVDAFDRE